jgi:hypothetical protein
MTYATVRAITSGELINLRKQGQWSKLYLAIFKPSVIYSATLAAVPASNDRVVQVAYTHVSGTLGNIKKDMTLYVGTTSGAYDLGIARIRKTPGGGNLYIGEESDIKWDAGGTIYLTVVDEFDLWARHINTVSDTDFRMDYDITYTNQNTVFDPIPVMGGHRVVKRTGATIGTTWDFTNSWVINSTISAYSTACPSASSITGGSTSTPTVNFNSDGWHPVYLTVTATNGKTYTGVRYVYVYSSSNMPATVFQLGECSVDYDGGGWSFDVTVQDGVQLDDVPERAMCILFAEDFYGTTQTSLGQLVGCENIVCVGKISEERININPEQSEITFQIQGYHYWFERINAFPTGVIGVEGTPENWAEMTQPTIQKVLYRLLHWGSTATTIMDIYLTNDSRMATELTAPSSNLWLQVEEIGFSSIFARPGIDRFGRLFVEIEPQVVPLASRTYPTVMTILERDWYDSVNVERIIVTETGRVDLSGIVTTSSEDGDALFSLSQGHVFSRYGNVEVIDRLLLSTQAASNQSAGLILGWRNNPFPNIELNLSANNRMIDCFPRQRIVWSIATDDTPRAFSLSGFFVPRRIQFRWDSETGWLETSISIELESVQQLSTKGDPPGEEENVSIPPAPPPLPPLPPPGIIIPGEIPSGATMKAIMHSTTYGLLFSENFNEEFGGDVLWRTVNAGLTDVQYKSINQRIVTPSGEIYVAGVRGTGFGNPPFVAYAPAIGSTFTVIEDETTIAAKYVGASVGQAVNGIGYNPLTGQVMYMISNDDGALNYTQKILVGSGISFSETLQLPTNHYHKNSVGNISFGENEWRITGSLPNTTNVRFLALNSSGTAIARSADAGSQIGISISSHHVPISTTDSVFIFKSDGVILVTGNGAVAGDFTTIIGTDMNYLDLWNIYTDCDPTGMYLFTSWDTGQRGKSSDGGATMVGIPSLPFEGHYSYCYIGGADVASHWGASAGSVYYSKDGGNTWSDQGGNLIQIAPIAGFTNIKVWF